jgi:hypothetical protein
MIHVSAMHESTTGQPSLFLAGGVGGVDWQSQLIARLAGTSLVVFNPRRARWLPDDVATAREQIAWEFRQLRRATARLFWFPPETNCPLTLYELGGWTRTCEPLFVGMHPEYPRRLDLELQLALARPDVEIVYTLEALSAQVIAWEQSL